MCGIAGILGRLNEVNRAALNRMSEAMVHRGPDDAGTWESAVGADGLGALLAFRRLAILDLSPSGAQPMVDPLTGHVLLFNGEVYNFQALRQRLASAGHTFRSTGDAAVVLRALATEGPAALPSFRGMFALALWDPAARTLLLARDPLGVKPLYVARSADASGGWSVAFASELRALLASGLLGTPRLDPSAVASVVWNGFVVGPGTILRGVEVLSPGQLQLYGERGDVRRTEAFWQLPGPAGAVGPDEEALAAALEESVRLHLISDRPLGVFLSGGIDSSAVANLAQKANRGPVHTFTLAFEEEEFNEGPMARNIAQAIGTEHQEVLLTEEKFVAELDRALDSLDQPTFDGLNSYYMSHAVRQAGFTVALVGTGGDELFGGYTSFRDLPVLYRWSQRLDWMPRAALVGTAQLGLAAFQPQRGEMPRQTRWAKLPEMVRHGDSLVSLYQLAYALFLPNFQEELLGHARLGAPRGRAASSRCGLTSNGKFSVARPWRPSASWSSVSSSASVCCATMMLPAWLPRLSSGFPWWTRCCSSTSSEFPMARATTRWRRRRCSGASACADWTPRSSNAPSVASCFPLPVGFVRASATTSTPCCVTRTQSAQRASSPLPWRVYGRAFWTEPRDCTGRGFGRSTSWCAGASGTASVCKGARAGSSSKRSAFRPYPGATGVRGLAKTWR